MIVRQKERKRRRDAWLLRNTDGVHPLYTLLEKGEITVVRTVG
jgi:hypothetical protein